MLITRRRDIVQAEMSSLASDNNTTAIGIYGRMAPVNELLSWRPGGYLRKVCVYLKQWFSYVGVQFTLTVPSLVPEIEYLTPQRYSQTPEGVNIDSLITYLQSTIGDVCDLVYFDVPTFEDMGEFYNHLFDPDMVAAFGPFQHTVGYMQYWMRWCNTYAPAYAKMTGLAPKEYLGTMETARMIMNLLDKNGKSLYLPRNYVPDYGSVGVVPYFTDDDGAAAFSFADPPQAVIDARLFVMEKISLMTPENLVNLEPVNVLADLRSKVASGVKLSINFVDFERGLYTDSYIPRLGAVRIDIGWAPNDEEDSLTISDYYFIGCDKDLWSDVETLQDVPGTPNDLTDLRDNFTRKLLDKDYQNNLPTTRTTGAINPIKTF